MAQAIARSERAEVSLKQDLDTHVFPRALEVLAPSVDPAFFKRVVANAALRNPMLAQADRRSLLLAISDLASMGLIPDGKQAALVTYKESDQKGGKVIVNGLPMIWGVVKRLRELGDLKSCAAEVVHEHDHFVFRRSAKGVEFEWERRLGADRGNVIGVFAQILQPGMDDYEMDVMDVPEIKSREAVSRAKHGPWKSWWEEMAKKTVLHRLLKRIPISEAGRAIVQKDVEATGLPEEYLNGGEARAVDDERKEATGAAARAQILDQTAEPEQADTGEIDDSDPSYAQL